MTRKKKTTKEISVDASESAGRDGQGRGALHVELVEDVPGRADRICCVFRISG